MTTHEQLVQLAGDFEILDAMYADRIDEKCHSTDEEIDHGAADALLLELLERLGFKKTVTAFNAVKKWYA